MLRDSLNGERKMLNLIRFYITCYLNVLSRTPAMDDSDGYLFECMLDLDQTMYCLQVWSIACVCE